MIVSLPLFYDTNHAQAIMLCLLQLMEIVRFLVVWPFYRQWRNIVRLCLECALGMFFFCVLIQTFLIREIMVNNPDTLPNAVRLFYRFGWAGFGLVFFFNSSFIVLLLYDLVLECRALPRMLMCEARKLYYYNKIKSYEEQNEELPLALANKWVKLGNLNNRNYEELPDISIRVECFKISKHSGGIGYEIEMNKLLELFMNIEFNFAKDNNVSVGKKIKKKFTLTRELSKNFYNVVDNLYQSYEQYRLEHLIIKTFLNVEQSLLKPSNRINMSKAKMRQKVEIEMRSGDHKSVNLDKLMDGFPVSIDDLKMIP
jgi:hypothetical protein